MALEIIMANIIRFVIIIVVGYFGYKEGKKYWSKPKEERKLIGKNDKLALLITFIVLATAWILVIVLT